MTFGTQKGNFVEEVIWRPKNIFNSAWKYQLWGCRPNIVTFHPEHIFQLVLYRDVLPFKLLTRKFSIFSLQKRNLDQGSVLFLPWLLQIMGSRYLSCPLWAHRPDLQWRALSQPLCSNPIWPSSSSKGNAFCIVIREALFSECLACVLRGCFCNDVCFPWVCG